MSLTERIHFWSFLSNSVNVLFWILSRFHFILEAERLPKRLHCYRSLWKWTVKSRIVSHSHEQVSHSSTLDLSFFLEGMKKETNDSWRHRKTRKDRFEGTVNEVSMRFPWDRLHGSCVWMRTPLSSYFHFVSPRASSLASNFIEKAPQALESLCPRMYSRLDYLFSVSPLFLASPDSAQTKTRDSKSNFSLPLLWFNFKTRGNFIYH